MTLNQKDIFRILQRTTSTSAPSLPPPAAIATLAGVRH